mgnify:CR=1 FL=1
MKINLANIKKARNLLNKRECVAIPTETVYGIAGNAYSDTACKKIFRLKKRPMNNPLIIHYYDLKKLKNDCDLNADFLKLYKRFCPGPITFILNQKKKSKISKVATNKKNTLAVRFPKHPVARILLKYLKFPIAAPSANISSRVSAVTSSDVKDDFGKKIEKTKDNKFKINEKLIFKYFGELKLNDNVNYFKLEEYLINFYDFCFDISPDSMIRGALEFGENYGST